MAELENFLLSESEEFRIDFSSYNVDIFSIMGLIELSLNYQDCKWHFSWRRSSFKPERIAPHLWRKGIARKSIMWNPQLLVVFQATFCIYNLGKMYYSPGKLEFKSEMRRPKKLNETLGDKHARRHAEAMPNGKGRFENGYVAINACGWRKPEVTV